MALVVLDASAVLAFVKGEAGADEVLPYIGRAAISAVKPAGSSQGADA